MDDIIKDTLIIGYNKAAGKDVAALSICKCKGDTLFCIKTLVGKEAEETYEKLTSFGCHIDDKLEKEKK